MIKTIKILKGPTTTKTGLYVDILCLDGDLTPGEIFEFCAPLALAAGYDPNGRADVSQPRRYGIKAYSYDVSLFDKLEVNDLT